MCELSSAIVNSLIDGGPGVQAAGKVLAKVFPLEDLDSSSTNLHAGHTEALVHLYTVSASRKAKMSDIRKSIKIQSQADSCSPSLPHTGAGNPTAAGGSGVWKCHTPALRGVDVSPPWPCSRLADPPQEPASPDVLGKLLDFSEVHPRDFQVR